MRSFSTRTLVVAALLTRAVAAQAQVPQAFTNLKVLRKDMPRPELVTLMREYASALGVRCQHCHLRADAPDFKGTDFASDALAPKRTARLMMKMAADINRRYLPPAAGAATRVECVTCHRGLPVPRTLDAELTDVLEKKGAAAAVARYRELRAAAYGRGGYDFGQGTLNQMGERLLKAGRAADALALLQLNLEFFPDASWTHHLAGETQLALGRKDEARAEYTRSAALEPANPLPRRRLAELGPAQAGSGFKNVQYFAGLTQLELQRTMNFMRASLGVHCDYCHVVTKEDGWQWEKDDKKAKATARKMIALVQQLNRDQFAGETAVSCYTCHRGHQRPVAQPPLPQPQPPFPTVAENAAPAGLPAAESVWQRFREAAHLPAAAPATRVMVGRRLGEPAGDLRIEQKGERAHVFVTTAKERLEQALDGAGGWVRDDKETRDLSAPERARVRETLDALAFPPDAPVDGRVTGKEPIDGHDAWVIEWAPSAGRSERLFFDAENGLLLRRERLTLRSIGRVPERVDYSDYRDVGGVKMPATFTTAYVDPWIGTTRTFSEIQLGVPVDDSVFARPAAAPPK